MRIAPFLIPLFLASPAFCAGDKASLARDRPAPGAARGPDKARAFVEANLRETLYHELAHAMIDVMDLPVFGPEEMAADMFSVVLMNTLFDDDDLNDMTGHVAAAYLDGVPKEGLGQSDGTAMWDLHGTDEQRYYNFICLMYGADPEARSALVDEFDLPGSRAESCSDEYDLTHRAWSQALADISPAAAPNGTALSMDWVLDDSSHAARFIESEVARLNTIIRLPEPVVVSVIPCGEENAFYDPTPREILICTELADFLADIAPQ